MTHILADLVRQTLQDPMEGARQVMGISLSRELLWSALALIVVLSVIAASVMRFLLPPAPDAAYPIFIMSSPFLLVLVMWGLLVLTVFCIHYIGRVFGGEGHFDNALKLVIWLQLILLAGQMIQIVFVLVSPALAGLLGVVISVYSIWLFVNFVTVLHGFTNRAAVLGGVIVSLIGAIFGLSLLLAFIAILFGVELPNG